MNPKFVPALIVDQNADSAKNMTAIVKDLFHRIYVQGDTKLVPGEIAEVKPSVVLLNLSLSHRTENLELAEIIGKGESAPLLLGYSDSHEPELLAHALESGLQDLFMRPFDSDIIASKINKFFQHEKTLKHDLAYTALRPALSARVKFQIRVTGVDENGVTFQGDHYISKGTVVNLPSHLSKDLTGQEKTEFLITRTWSGDLPGQHFSYGELKTPDEARSSALRRFILSRTT